MNENALGVILAAGDVVRCHTMPCLNRPTVGLHTWRTLVLLHWLYAPTQPPTAMTYTLLMHDVPELRTGDLPGDIKADDPRIGDLFEGIEDKIYSDLGIDMPALFDEEKMVVKFCDRADLAMYALEEYDMGNQSPRMLSMLARAIVFTRDAAAHLMKDGFPHVDRVISLLGMLDDRAPKW